MEKQSNTTTCYCELNVVARTYHTRSMLRNITPVASSMTIKEISPSHEDNIHPIVE